MTPSYDQIMLILSQIQNDLAEHMRRTAAAETRVDTLEDFVTETRAYMRGIKWLGVTLAGIITVAVGILQLIKGI